MTMSCRRFEFIICAVIMGLLCILGMTGNVTSFFVLCRHRAETATIMLLRVLAVSDSILLLTSIFVYCLPAVYPYTGVLRIFYEEFDVVRTYVWPFALMAHTITVWITVLVTLHRYCSICKALSNTQLYIAKATKLQVFAVVALSVLYNTPRFFEHHRISDGQTILTGNMSNVTCQVPVNLGDSRIYQIIYSNVLYFPVMYILPLIILTYLNVRLIKAMNGLRKRKQTLTGHRAKDDHITLIVIVIVIIFIICQTPALVNQIFWAILNQTERRCGQFHFYYTKVSDLLIILNSSVNFMIYCLFGKTFRRTFIDTFCRRKIGTLSTNTKRNNSKLNDGSLDEKEPLQILSIPHTSQQIMSTDV